jgi:hypothetical protein
MSDYTPRRHRTPAFPVVPAPPVNRPHTQITADPGSTVMMDFDNRPATWERAIDVVKNVVVIVTCLAVLYTLWAGYQALAELGRGLQQIQL